MAEPKRVPLLPVKATSNGKISPQKDQSFEKIQDEDEETIRLEISLGDSTEKACPEFSYVQKIKGQLVGIFSLYLVVRGAIHSSKRFTRFL